MGKSAGALSNLEAAKKGYDRLASVASEHGIEVVVVMCSMFGAMAIEMFGRNEGAYVAAIIGRVPEGEWVRGVGLAVSAHADFWAAAVAKDREMRGRGQVS
jgi:hypothetical protein